MKDLVDSIVNALELRSRIDRTSVKGVIGVVLAYMFWACCYRGVRILLQLVESASIEAQEFVLNVSLALVFAVSLWLLYYVLYYCVPTIIIIKYVFSPSFKNKEKSIESLLNKHNIEDIGRLHKAILHYLKESSSAKDVAVLYIWLKDKALLHEVEQTKFLNALAVDFPPKQTKGTNDKQSPVPSQSTFNDNVNRMLGKEMSIELTTRLKIVEMHFSKYLIE